MSEEHNNTKPAKQGYYILSHIGLVMYFPVEIPEEGKLEPLLALCLHQKPDGDLMCSIDERWGPLRGMD